MNSSPDKTGQGYLYSTLRLPKPPHHNAIRLSHLEESDSSDAETSYSPSPSPAFIRAERSPTSYTMDQNAQGSIRQECTPATAVEAFDPNKELAEGAETTRWFRDIDSARSSTEGTPFEDSGAYKRDGSLPVNRGGYCLLGTYQLGDLLEPRGNINYHDSDHSLNAGRHTQPTMEYLSPAPEGPPTEGLQLSPLHCVAHLRLLQPLADSRGIHPISEEDEEDEYDSDSLGSLSPLTELSSLASSPGVDEGGAVPPTAYKLDEVHPLLSPLSSLDHLVGIPSAGVSRPEDGEPEELVLH